MSISADDLLTLSLRLLFLNDSELEIRTSANRAYYAIFHYCKPISLKFSSGKVDKKLGSHERIINMLLEANSPDLKKAGFLRKCPKLS